jgi:hypothetical protein
MSLLSAATSWLVEPADRPPAPADGPPALADDPLAPADGPRRATRARLVSPFRPPSPPASTAVPLARVAVLGSPGAVSPVAAALALSCREQGGVASALVAVWPSDAASSPAPTGPALPGAATLAARLARRGVPTTARGRLAWLTLPTAADEAASMLRHAEAATGDLPVVLAVARPRDAAIDALLAERELLIVAAPPDSALAAVADADVRALRLPVQVCAPLPPGAVRFAALAGLRAPRLELPAASSPPAPPPPRTATRRAPGPAPGEEAW